MSIRVCVKAWNNVIDYKNERAHNMTRGYMLERLSKAIHASGFEKRMLKDYQQWKLELGSI